MRKKVICTNGPETTRYPYLKLKKKRTNPISPHVKKNQFETNHRSKYKKSNYRAFNIKLKKKKNFMT